MVKGAAALVALLVLSLTAPQAAAQTRRYEWFSSPTGNIGCWMDAQGVRCDVRVHTWRRPARPGGCELDWGDSLFVGRRGKAVWVCHGDTTLGSATVLRYGDRSKVGRFVCTSRTTGMRCVNTRNGHGFQISRTQYRRF